jgi:hypothetical protein
VRIACRRCDRRGSYRLARLAARFGAAVAMPELLKAISADCYYRKPRHPISGECQAYFLDLEKERRRRPTCRRRCCRRFCRGFELLGAEGLRSPASRVPRTGGRTAVIVSIARSFNWRPELFAGRDRVMRQRKVGLILRRGMRRQQDEARPKIRKKAERGHRCGEHPCEQRLSGHLILASHKIEEAMRGDM